MLLMPGVDVVVVVLPQAERTNDDAMTQIVVMYRMLFTPLHLLPDQLGPESRIAVTLHLLDQRYFCRYGRLPLCSRLLPCSALLLRLRLAGQPFGRGPLVKSRQRKRGGHDSEHQSHNY
jgi:hypothetical protein